MRRLFTTADALAAGMTEDALAWGVRRGWWVRIVRGVYGEGPEPPSALDRERAVVLARHTVARGALGGVLLGLDSVFLDGRPTRGTAAAVADVIEGVPCASAAQILGDLAVVLDDDTWEQAMESALRNGLTTVAELEALRRPRARRVMARRPPGAPPTGSLLETLTVQLVRPIPLLGEPVRQYAVRWADGRFLAKLDLCWPTLGLFAELDGQHHEDQPVYDASRETAVVAATGWLPARFSWRQIVHFRAPRPAASRHSPNRPDVFVPKPRRTMASS